MQELNLSLKMCRLWGTFDTEYAHRRARAWWFMAEGIRKKSTFLTGIAELLLL